MDIEILDSDNSSEGGSQLAPPEENTQLPPKHELIICHLVIDGFKATDIASKFEVTDSWISTMRRTPLWKKRIEELQSDSTEEAITRLKSLNNKAVDVVEETMISTNEHLKYKSAVDLLDRNRVGNSDSGTLQPPVFNLFIPPHYDRDS